MTPPARRAMSASSGDVADCRFDRYHVAIIARNGITVLASAGLFARLQ